MRPCATSQVKSTVRAGGTDRFYELGRMRRNAAEMRTGRAEDTDRFAVVPSADGNLKAELKAPPEYLGPR